MNAQVTDITNGGGVEIALHEVLRQCCLLPEYDQAAALWMKATRPLRVVGLCTLELFNQFETKLLETFERRLQQQQQACGQVVTTDGGTVNIYNGRQEQAVKTFPDMSRIVEAIKRCQQYMWGDSSLAVIFCVCQQYYGVANNKSQFERDLVRHNVVCPQGTISKAFSNNPYMSYPIEQWPQHDAKERVMKLVAAFRQEVEGFSGSLVNSRV